MIQLLSIFCRKKALAFLLIATILVSSVAGQMNYARQDSTNKKILFHESFVNNQNRWYTGSDKHMTGLIENGYYNLAVNNSAYGVAKDSVFIDATKDFEIEAGIKFADERSDKKSSAMLFWGRDSMQSFYFFLTKDGYPNVSNCDELGKHHCKTVLKSKNKAAINANAFQLLTIRKVANTYYFFINKEYVFSMPFLPFYGNHIGIGATKKTTVFIDFLTVSYL